MLKFFRNHEFNFNILWVLLAAFIIRIIFSLWGTLKLDQGTFIAWSINLADNGFRHFYLGWSDYFPGYLYILYILGKIRGVLPDVLLYKLPAILADVMMGFLIYKIIRKYKNHKWGIIASFLYLFNPAILSNSTFWGQIDSLTALFSMLSVYLVVDNYLLSAAALAVGTLIKPQAAFIAPVLLLIMIKNKVSVSKILKFGVLGLGIFVAGFLPFDGSGNFIGFLLTRFSTSFGQYPFNSVNAFNFWGFFGFWKPDGVNSLAGLIITAITIITGAIIMRRQKRKEYFLAAVVFVSSFLFLTRMHERHLLPALAPLLVSGILDLSLLPVYFGFSLTYLANIYYSYNWVTFDFVQVFSPFSIKLFIIANLAFFVFMFWRPKIKIKMGKIKEFKLKKDLPVKKAKILLVLILVFSFITRIYNLGIPANEYFDEVYHAFTARQILHGNPKAWEWWNTPPAGFAYEWTHPPLAKLGMVLGMIILGENSFGWRFPGAILGVGAVYLVYLIAKEIFSDKKIGILSAAVFSLDGLTLVMSRIGMNDTYMLFFMLGAIYFFLKQKDLFSSLSFGLALASKWSALWAVPVLFVLWLKRKERFKILPFVYFLILPFAVYLLSYTPMFLTGHNLAVWWEMQKQMWWYHTRLKATHPYTSSWWSWPLLVRPVYLYTSNEVGKMVSRIYAMGNPVVFWFGLISVIISSVFAFIEKNKKLGLVVFSYLVFFVPWAASPRIMFLYHYLPSIPFLAIAAGYILRRNPKITFAYLLICLFAFIYFYSHWIGLPVFLGLDRNYYWFASWR